MVLRAVPVLQMQLCRLTACQACDVKAEAFIRSFGRAAFIVLISFLNISS